MFRPLIPMENRRSQMELAQGLGDEAFRDHVWSEREKLQPATKATGNWPKTQGAQTALPPLADRAPAEVARIGKKK